ncbi:MAG: transposase [Planctomycetota bacterium]|jgi:putative transposase
MHITRDKLGIRWLGYVVMPEHVHVLVLPMAAGTDTLIPISKVLQYLKQYVGRYGKATLRTIWSCRRTLGSPPLDKWANEQGPHSFWKPRAYDFNITCEKTFYEKLDYMHKNPVIRNLVDRADMWLWSSYRYYELGDDSLMSMDWDGSWPIV